MLNNNNNIVVLWKKIFFFKWRAFSIDKKNNRNKNKKQKTKKISGQSDKILKKTNKSILKNQTK